MNKPASFTTGVAIAAFTLLSACIQASRQNIVSDAYGQVSVPASGDIHIGVIVSPSSSSGLEGTELLRGVQLAVDSLGSIQNRDLSIDVFNTDCSSEGDRLAVDAALNNDKLVGIVGPDCDSTCKLAASRFDEAHIPVISPACGNPDFVVPETRSPVFFRTIFESTGEASVAADFAFSELGSRRAVIVSSDDDASRAYAKDFSVRFLELGGVITDEYDLGKDDRLFRTLGANISRNRPDVIYAPVSQQYAVDLTNQIDAAGVSTIPIIGNRRVWSNWLIRYGGNSVDGLYATGPYLPLGRTSGPDSDYLLKFAENPPNKMYAYAFDATSILVDSVRKAGIIDSNENLVIGRQALLNAIAATANFSGVTGVLTCTAWGDCSANSIAVGKISEQQWTVVYIP